METRSILELKRRTPHFDDLSLFGCGVACGEPQHGAADTDPAYRLYFGVAGRGKIDLDGSLYALGRGDGLSAAPGQRLVFHEEGEEPWRYFWVAFRGGRAADCLRLSGLADTDVFRCAGSDELLALVREMLALEAPCPENELMLQSLLFRFFSALARQLVSGGGGQKGGRDNAYVQKAVEYIHSSYATGITVSDIAHYVSLNRSYLSTLFQKVLEVSPQDYLAFYRMSRAKERLVQTTDTIAAIAQSCGYADPQVFSRAFKQQVGMTPASYRRQALEEQNRGG